MQQHGGTLAANDISVHRGADAILERLARGHARQPDRRRRPERPGQDDAAPLAGRPGRARPWLDQAEPADPARGLPAAGARPRARAVSATWRAARAKSRRPSSRLAPVRRCGAPASMSSRSGVSRRSRAEKGAGRRSHRSCSRASMSISWTSRRTISTSKGSTCWSGSCGDSMQGSSSSRTIARFSTEP